MAPVMMSYSSQVEQLIEQLGGCGLFQILACVIIHGSSFVSVWSILAMSFIGYNPGYTCHTLDVYFDELTMLNISHISPKELCSIGQNSGCSSFIFPNEINTAVSEWKLVCDKRWIVAFIIMIQMIGILVGYCIAFLIADSIGRKPTLLSGVLIMTLFNFVGYFAMSWKSYSCIRFLIGIGVGFFYTVQKPYMTELIPSKWRSFVLCCPAEPFISMIFALASWWLHDWKTIHLLMTLNGVVIAMFICLLPESFRWLISKMKFEQAKKSIHFAVTLNRVSRPDLENLFDSAAREIEFGSKMTNVKKIDVTIPWSSMKLRKITMSLSVLWFCAHTCWYSMSLGMESISANIYITIFLINLVDVPTVILTASLVNRFGRRKICLMACMMSCILCCLSGILQHYGERSSSQILQIFTLLVSLCAKMSVTIIFFALFLYTTELYPTVIRTSGFGFTSIFGKLGSIASPLLIYLDGQLPGSMYFISGILMFLSIGGVIFLKETKDLVLQDSMT